LAQRVVGRNDREGFLVDVVWAKLVFLGVEKVRIVPGFTETNPLDLYYMPYTHSLVAAVAWFAAAAIAYRLIVRRSTSRASLLVGCAVFSHWILDFVVHRPDLPLYDDNAPRWASVCGIGPCWRSVSRRRCSWAGWRSS
jgi:hypothetical protein